MALGIFEETFGTARNKYGVVSKREATGEHLVAVTAAVQAVVDTFRDPNTGDRFIVALSPNTEAYTMAGAKRIVVSYKPIFDKGLKVSTVCTVMTGLVLHEIGHTLYTFPNLPAIKAAFGDPTGYRWGPKQHDQLAYSMLNVGDDARLEARMAANLPVARDIFPTMLHWVALTSGMSGTRLRYTGKAMSLADRVNFACRSIRYPWTATWSSDEVTRAERLWWQDWGRQYIAVDDRDADSMVRLVKVALDRLRNAEEVDLPDEDDATEETLTPPPIIDNPFGTDFDKDEDEDEGDDEGEGNDVDDEDDEDEDDEPEGDDVRDPWDEGDDDEDAEDEAEGEDDESDDEAEDEDGGTKPGEDEDDESEDESGGSKVDIPDDLSDEGDDEGEDGDDDGDEAESTDVGDDDEPEDDTPKTWPTDFDAHQLDGQVDRVNHPTDWRSQNEGGLLQKVMDIDASTEKVPTGVWGSAKVEVRSVEQLRTRGY